MGRAGRLVVALALCACAFIGTGSTQAQDQHERKVVVRIPPVYPELAKRMHMGGVVKLDVLILANGKVKSVKVVGGSPALIGAAVDAVGKWKFEVASEETSEIIQLTFEPHEK